MKKFILIACLFLSVAQQASAQYEASSIPKELRSHAAATIREDIRTFVIKGPDDMTQTGTHIMTIHNPKGDAYAEQVFGYDKSRQIKSIKGEIYDGDGKLIKKFTMKDFKDYSASDEVTMFSSSRLKHYDPKQNSYPYTIKLDYETKHNQSLIIGSWNPNYTVDVSVEKSSYQIVTPSDLTLRILTKNLQSPGKVEEQGKQKIYTWEAKNIPASRSEPFSPIRQITGMHVMAVPEAFSYYKYDGSATDWKSFGNWMNATLLKDKRKLAPATIAKVQELCKDLKTDREKAKAIYEYMQKKTRYISIQIGIGGQEPFPATDVDRLGYGDCKALVNYTQALLDVANIPSYYCIVEAGNRKIDVEPEFANIIDGNHVILCLPFANDTTWLECTSQDMPFGYLGDFTDDRLVLACTPEGGQVMRTAVYDYQDNLQHRIANLKLDSLGNMTGSLSTAFAGTQFDNHFSNLKKVKDEQVKALRKQYDINRIQFLDVNYKVNSAPKLTLQEDLQISIENLAVRNKDNMTVFPNIFNRSAGIPDIRNRKNPVKITRGYTDIDETIIELPKNLKAIILPKTVKNEVPMGSYEFTVKLEDGKMICYRKLVLKEGEFPADSYESFYNFMSEVAYTDSWKYNFTYK